MIKKSVFEDELISGMQRELTANAKTQGVKDLVKAADYLHAAMEIFEEAGMSSKADRILNILSKIAVSSTDEMNDINNAHHKKPADPRKVSDPHMRGLTSDKMISNLKHHGTVFNMANDGQPDNSKADDLLNLDVDDNNLEVSEKDLPSEMDFEDEI